MVGGVNVPAGGLAVGFEPQIEVIPEGSMMTAAAVISADLRYVRLAVVPTGISKDTVGTTAGHTDWKSVLQANPQFFP